MGNFRIPLIFLHYGVGFGTLHFQGCQDFIGPIPQSFLISRLQIKTKKIKILPILKKIINLQTKVERFDLLQPLKKMLKRISLAYTSQIFLKN
jgi:hypothetical protein